MVDQGDRPPTELGRQFLRIAKMIVRLRASVRSDLLQLLEQFNDSTVSNEQISKVISRSYQQAWEWLELFELADEFSKERLNTEEISYVRSAIERSIETGTVDAGSKEIQNDSIRLMSELRLKDIMVRDLYSRGVPAEAYASLSQLKLLVNHGFPKLSPSVQWYEDRLSGAQLDPVKARQQLAQMSAVNEQLHVAQGAMKLGMHADEEFPRPEDKRSRIEQLSPAVPRYDAEGVLDIGPNQDVDGVASYWSIGFFIRTQKGLADIVLAGLPRNIPKYIAEAVIQYRAELETDFPIFGYLGQLMDVVASAVGDDSESAGWLPDGLRVAIEKLIANHQSETSNWSEHRQRESSYSAFSLNDELVQGPDFVAIYSDITVAAQCAEEDGKITSRLKRILQALETIAEGVEFSSSKPRKLPSAPKISVEDVRPASIKKRHILGSAGLLSLLSSIITIGESGTMSVLLQAVRKALRLLEVFIGKLWSIDE